MLTGADLLARVKELGDCAKTDLAKGCGYVVTKKDGSEQVKFTQFYEALLEAKGLTGLIACEFQRRSPGSDIFGFVDGNGDSARVGMTTGLASE